MTSRKRGIGFSVLFCFSLKYPQFFFKLKKMFFRKLCLATCCFVAFATVPAFAETVIDFDVVVDTTWTKAMSPIVIKGSTRNDKIRRVTSGAVLTIEPGVEVKFDSGMSLHVTSQCLRGYGSEACYRDRDNEIKMPKLIAKGTSVQPIIFTSDNKNPQPGVWGSVIVDARNSEIEWTEFRYGGQRSKRAFVEVNNSIFRNNLIEDGGAADSALWVSSQTVEGNVIRNNNGDAIFCDHQCEIKENFITENTGDAIEMSTLLETKINGNFIYKNGGYGISNKSILSLSVVVEDNFFRENAGGIYSHRSSEGLKFQRNNFLKNKDFAIKSDINNRTGKIYPASGNWFGIDTGPKSLAGAFFVSTDYDVSGFLKNGNSFSITGSSKAARSYRQYLSGNNLGNAYFVANVKRKAIIGSESRAGSLLRYSVTLDNQTTKAADAQLEITPPGDQLLLLCSAQSAIGNFSYLLENACTASVASDITFENNRLVWRPKGIPALSEKTLFFVMATRPTVQAPSLPRLDFNSKPFSYRIGSSVELKETGGGNVAESSSSTTQVIETPVVTTTPTPVAAPVSSGGLATGTVSRQIIYGTLQYVLSTGDGKHYSLFNKWKWRDIDNFTKGVDKHKKISVYGDFYVNRYGKTTGIKFTRFEIID
jgi:hypothetical protein